MSSSKNYTLIISCVREPFFRVVAEDGPTLYGPTSMPTPQSRINLVHRSRAEGSTPICWGTLPRVTGKESPCLLIAEKQATIHKGPVQQLLTNKNSPFLSMLVHACCLQSELVPEHKTIN